MKAIVVIPAFNEAGTLGTVLGRLRAARPDLDVVVVDDASTDRTAEVARGIGVQVVRLPLNLGIGGAVKAGYKYALSRAYEVAIQFDADGQHDEAQIDRLVAPIEADEADMVIGSRFIRRIGYQSEFSRRLAIRLFSSVTSRLIRTPVTDITSGFRAVGPRLLRLFARAYPCDFPDAEAILVAAKCGCRVVEVPVEMRPRAGGVSFFRLDRKLVYPFKTSISIVATALRQRSFYGGS